MVPLPPHFSGFPCISAFFWREYPVSNKEGFCFYESCFTLFTWGTKVKREMERHRMNYGKYKICMWQMEFRTSVYISRAYMHLDGLMNGPGQDSDLHPTLVLWGNTLQEIGSLETATQ